MANKTIEQEISKTGLRLISPNDSNILKAGAEAENKTNEKRSGLIEEDEEDMSDGYLDNGVSQDENDNEAAKNLDEYELNSNNISPKPKSMMTITMGKSPDVTLHHKRTIKLKAQPDEKVYH